MSNKLGPILSWVYFGVIAVFFTASGVIALVAHPGGGLLALSLEFIFPQIPVAFAFFGALINSRQPGNRIGLLMMLPALSLFPLVDAYMKPFVEGIAPLPPPPAPGFLILLWFSNWNWILFVFPVIFIILLFPTGRPLNRRWGWTGYLGLFLAALLPFFSTTSKFLSSGEASWTYPNPVGFLEMEWIESILTPFFFIFPAWIILCVISLFIRFRRAQAVEREQIKWLFFAAVVFAAGYMPSFIFTNFNEPNLLWNILFAIGMFALPTAIAMAILRYRLYDIELIIRRTLQYGLLTGLLSLVYFGGVAFLQSALTAVGGKSSPAVIVLTTLGIAALFNPLRRRIQDFIDRRFYRQKYDSEQALARFASAARSKADLVQLSEDLTSTVQVALQPAQVSLWLNSKTKAKTTVGGVQDG